MHIVIFVGGTLRSGSAVDSAIEMADRIIAADSGAETALRYGLLPAAVLGDFDSLNSDLSQQLSARGSQLIQAQVEKDETDTELAIDYAIQQGATTITLLGGLEGARFDHSIANLLLLAAYEAPSLRIIDGPVTCWLLRGPGRATINGEIGDLLSLFPLNGEASGVSTNNLYYPLVGETLRFGRPRGISNLLTAAQAEVTLESGLLLLAHTRSNEISE